MKVTEDLLRMSWEPSLYSVKIMATAMMKVTCVNVMSTTRKGCTLAVGMRFSLVLFRNCSLLSVGEESALMP